MTRERMKAKAIRYQFFGQRLTLQEIAQVSGTDGPTIRYRIQKLGMTAEDAATRKPLRNFRERPKGRPREARP